MRTGGTASAASVHPAMRSPVNWALLGLVIQRQSYGYELVQRFQRVYGEAIDLSSPSQIYTALDALIDRELIETVPFDELEAGGGRQPKPHYRATPEGARQYECWLVSQAAQERRRSRMFARQLAALSPRAALRVLDRCERELLRLASAPTGRAGDRSADDERTGLDTRLIAEEDRLGAGARLTWIEYARRELRALATRGTEP